MSAPRSTSPRAIALLLLALLVGLLAGIYVQHRWPVGRWGEKSPPPPVPAQKRIEAVRALPPEKRLVILAAGQSNAANYGATRGSGGPGVFVFADGGLFDAVDPLPGGDGRAGSIWTRLGARLIHTGAAETVVFAVAAAGSSRAGDWTPGGRCHAQLIATLRALHAAQLPPDFVLWQQGESEADDPGASGHDYGRALETISRTCLDQFPHTRFVVARATQRVGAPRNDQIRLAQLAFASRPGIAPGPDLDALDGPFRSDGVHFNDRGLAVAADRWLEALRPLLAARNPATRP